MRKIMNARNEVVELLKRLEGEFEKRKHDLKQEGKVVDSNEDWNARMVALRAYTESAFASSFLLTQDMLRHFGTTLSEIELIDKHIANLHAKQSQIESALERFNAEAEFLRRQIATLFEEIKGLQERVSSLEMRPPGGGPPTSPIGMRYRP